METLWQDMRFAVRTLRKSPGFAAIAIATLALGIGATTAIFTVVNAVLLQPLPYPQSDRLVFLSEESPQLPGMSVSYPDLQDWRAQNSTFEQIAGTQSGGFTLLGGERPEQVSGRYVGADFFSVLRAQPAIGRFFTRDEDKPGAAPVAVISYGLWQRRFGGDSGVIGRAFTAGSTQYTVVGVLPRGFLYRGGLDDIFVTLGRRADEMTDRNGHPGIYAIGRMKPGITLAQARTDLKGIAARLAKQFPISNANIGVSVQSYREVIVGDARRGLLILFAAVALVLLVACANVANLLLARASTREREVAIRMAVGARRSRLVRQLLTESVLLAAFGGALGLLLGAWCVDLLVKAAPDALPRVREIRLNGWVLGFTAAATLLTGLIFGLAPALHASATNLQHSLKESMRSTGSAGWQLLRSGLIVAEIAVSLVLLVAAGLLLRSFARVMEVNPGLNPHNVFTARLILPDDRYPTIARTEDFYQRLLERLNSMPGVVSAATITPLPFSGEGWQSDYRLDDRPRPHAGEYPNGDIHYVSPGYLQTMQVPLLRGRGITEQDRSMAPPVVLVNQQFADRWWPGQDPIGKRIRMPAGEDPRAEDDHLNPWRTVVGVVGDVKQYGLDVPVRTEIYVPLLQRNYPRQTRDGRPALPLTYTNLVVRTTGNPSALTDSVRAAVAAIDKDQPIADPTSLDDLLATTVASRRTSMVLLGVFSGLALLLAAIGLYGVMAYSVAQRTREIGIRMALGAARGDVLRMVMSNALRLTASGLLIGIVGALALTRLLGGLLYEVKTTDPAVFSTIVGTLMVVAMAASYLPARRATKVDPMVALRYE